MARNLFIASAALAALAAGIAVPAAAQDGGGRHGRWNGDGGGATAQAERPARPERNWRAEARAQQAPQAAPQQVQVPQSGRWQQRAEQAPAQRQAPEGGWRSQRPAEGTRYGRNWDNGGTVTRPAPADNAATPQAPQRGWSQQRSYRGSGTAGGDWQRNRTYTDQTRDRTYGGDRQQTYRNGYRDGRTTDAYRDRRDQTNAYRNGYDRGYSSAGRDYRRWDRTDWRRDRRYDWQSYRTYNRDVYRLGRYYSPYRNWSYSRLSIGFFLQPLFYSQNYWIDDPWQYRLPEAYGPYRWVRYYDDALLVDIYSGEVVDVINDFFW